jgi:hypothetical protein
VVDESDAAFAAAPSGMPDTASSLGSPSHYEHLTPGHSYYIHGPSMQVNSPAPVMPNAWQGMLSATSPHRVGGIATGSAAAATTPPQPYLSHGPYLLLPVFNPVSGEIQSYGVFVPVSTQPNWATLVNSVPAVHGYVVQATSVPGWITFDEGAVSIKLLQ